MQPSQHHCLMIRLLWEGSGALSALPAQLPPQTLWVRDISSPAPCDVHMQQHTAAKHTAARKKGRRCTPTVSQVGCCSEGQDVGKLAAVPSSAQVSCHTCCSTTQPLSLSPSNEGVCLAACDTHCALAGSRQHLIKVQHTRDQGLLAQPRQTCTSVTTTSQAGYTLTGRRRMRGGGNACKCGGW